MSLFLSEPVSEAQAKFISMSRVSGGLHDYDWSIAGGVDPRIGGARRVAASPIRSNRRPLPASAARLLRIAWQTELAARLGDQLDDPGHRLATLQTLPVQAYYSVFSAGRALTHVAGSPKDQHASLHTSYASEHHRRAAGVWGILLLRGDPEVVATCELAPPVVQPLAFNPMENRANEADYVWAALRMARRWRLERARQRWLESRQNRTKKGEPYKRLPTAARQKHVLDERPTTVMDFLYELRCSTNYRSLDEYAIEVEDQHVARFHRGLTHLLDLGLLTYEGQIAQYTGLAALRDEFDDWSRRVKSVGTWVAEAGRGRLEALHKAGL